MPNWLLPALSLLAILILLYMAFLRKPASRSGREGGAEVAIDLDRDARGHKPID